MPMTGRNGRPVPIHRLRPNHAEWSPPSVIVLDSETQWTEDGPDEIHTLRLWAAVHVDRRDVRKTQGPVTWGWGDDRWSLADWLETRVKGRTCVWLYCHNLNFDLVTTDLTGTMTARGWTLSDFSVSAGSPWLRLKKDRCVLTVCDSWSWLPESLASLAERVGRKKEPLPAPDDGVPEWLTRCGVDVELTARCMLDLMDWWDREHLGRWTISGAGTGWNALRHKPTDFPHVIDPEPELIAQDRDAVRGGRKDAAVVRSERGGPWVELDLVGAYPTVARELPCPVRRAVTFDQLPTDAPALHRPGYGVIAECVVTTLWPRYPVRLDGVTWYPVGTFTTTLAGPEIAWAKESGHLNAIGPGQVHRMGDALHNWASWVLDPSDAGAKDVPPVAAVFCKATSRSALGKFAARGHSSTALEGDAPAGWSVTDMWDLTADRRGAEVTMAGRKWLVTYDQDTENCYPAVLAWIQAEVRVRLGKVLEELDGAWWTCDTDGLLVDMSVIREWARVGLLRLGKRPRDHMGLAAALCQWLAPMVAPLTIRPKRLVDSLAVLGPQHLVAGGQRRMSGVRADAVEVEPGTFRSRDWPKLRWQMNNSTPGTYRRPERTATFTGPTVHRWVVEDGSTRPVQMVTDRNGRNRILPWSESRWAAQGDQLGPAQYQGLSRLH